MLRNLHIPSSYFTATSEQLLKELYLPAFRESNVYRRGVAYFSISFLLHLLDAVVEFVQRGGVIQLVTSVQLDEATVASFALGYALTEEGVESRLLQTLEDYRSTEKKDGQEESVKLDVVANMIAAHRLQLKVAYVPTGLYHEKIGVFSDAEGSAISFIGSANATMNAYHNNFETVNVFSSWEMPQLVAAHRKHFERLWDNEIDGLNVISFPEAVERHFLSEYRTSPDLTTALENLLMLRRGATEHGTEDRLRDYQQKAIREFVQNGYRHFFEMATGTGKTFTAIKAIERMMEEYQALNVLILVPLKDLQDQWIAAIKKSLKANHSIFRFGGGGQANPNDFNLSTAGADIDGGRFAAIGVCVYDTFFSHTISEIDPVEGPVLLVVDEAHNLTPGNLKLLRHYISDYRLGLSATPERYDKKETEAIFKFFLPEGKQSFVFGLEAAIEKGYLSEYEYYPIPVSLTQDELEDYERLTKAISVAQSIYDKEPTKQNQKKLDDLKMNRSRVVKKSVNKLSVLREMVASGDYSFSNSIVFCGPGSVDWEGYSGTRILDLVTLILTESSNHEYFPAKYTSGEADRPARLENFKQGHTDTLVAIKCFDEGLDVPALDKIYIMSSDSSLRQTIQRRGRVLRVSKNTGKVKAFIYDFVAGIGEGPSFFPLATECPRVHEYARLSLNPEASEFMLRYYTPVDGVDLFDDYLLDD